MKMYVYTSDISVQVAVEVPDDIIDSVEIEEFVQEEAYNQINAILRNQTVFDYEFYNAYEVFED
jgi:hypothetical protein